jgi:dTDP-4-dehydrorhamnose 3,5-epimerase-like enzyme
MTQSLDIYSKPLKQEITKFSTIYWFNPRDSKKGRLFMPVYDERYPLAFPVRFTYISRFLEKDNQSGNHYHEIKEEILIPLHGTFDILLEDVRTKERESHTFRGEDNIGIYIRKGIAHKIISKNTTGLLLVLASKHSDLADEIEYGVK